MNTGNILALSKPDSSSSSASPEQKLKEVAALYEKEFMRQLVKSMRATVPTSGLVTQNQAEKIFSEELYHHYGDIMADHGPQSLREHIYRNLVDKFGAQLGIKDKSLKTLGMMNLPIQAQKFAQVKAKETPLEAQYRFSWKDWQPNLDNMQVVAPLSGKVLSVNHFGDYSGVDIEIEHDHGLRSQLKFLGRPHVMVGDVLNAGQHVATLGDLGCELVWRILYQGPKTSSD